MKKITKTVGTLGVMGFLVMNNTFAAEDESFWYIGGNIGQSQTKIDNKRIITPLLSRISDRDTDTAYKLLGGYQFNKNFAVEGGYFDLGKLGYTASSVAPALAATKRGDMKLDGWNLDAVGMLPLSERFSLFGRVGVNYAEAKDSFSSTGAAPVVTNANPSKTTTSYKYGVGAQYDFTESLGMRLEAERYRMNDAIGNDGDVDLYTIGLVYRFKSKKQEPVKPAPAVVAAPARVIVPVVAKTEQYCSILDIQFEINQDDIQREEKEKIAVVGRFMKKYPNTTAVIEGHTDNVGSAEQNLKLSQHRAESVVAYLVEAHQIAPSRLSAVGYGERYPVADNSTKEGKQMNRRIGAVIACATDIEGLKVQSARTTMALELEFDAYKDDIKPEYRAELARVANFLKANPAVTVTVEAHAGKFVGKKQVTEEVSMEVSKQRAESVRDYLVDKLDVPRAQVSTAAFGQIRRVAYGTTLEGQQENRRVNLIINYPSK